MLKIRDDVDLKELQKFKELKCMLPKEDEFHLKYENIYTDMKCLYSTDSEDTYCEIDIMEDRTIRSDLYLDLIYDLIKANLVEKVEG